MKSIGLPELIGKFIPSLTQKQFMSREEEFFFFFCNKEVIIDVVMYTLLRS